LLSIRLAREDEREEVRVEEFIDPAKVGTRFF
jgi:hypothetical protein